MMTVESMTQFDILIYIDCYCKAISFAAGVFALLFFIPFLSLILYFEPRVVDLFWLMRTHLTLTDSHDTDTVTVTLPKFARLLVLFTWPFKTVLHSIYTFHDYYLHAHICTIPLPIFSEVLHFIYIPFYYIFEINIVGFLQRQQATIVQRPRPKRKLTK